MKKALVILVSILAVIVPLTALGAVETYDLVLVRAIELPTDQMQIDGNAGWWLGQNFASTIRQAATETTFIKIAVSGTQFNQIVDTKTRVSDSGWYKPSSRKLVAEHGSMIAPSEHFSVSVFASVDYRNQGGLVSALTRGRVNVDSTKAKAKVVVRVEPIDVSSGLNNGHGYSTTGEASKILNLNVSAAGFNNYGGYNSGDSNPEATLIAEAAGKAVRSLVSQLTADAVKDPICSVDITSGKSVWKIGTEISFFRNDKQIAKYEILGIEGRTLAVRILKQDRLPKAGDPFKIK